LWIAGSNAPLDLPSNEAIGDIACSCTTITLDGRAKQPELSHLWKDAEIEFWVEIALVPPGAKGADKQSTYLPFSILSKLEA
jgi:hypothetical protein